MNARYSAFTFCDRITDFVPARSAQAVFLVPAHLGEFASCLVAEAVGQLAAWVSMAHIDFRGRPVAALAGATHFLGAVNPGQTLGLEIDIESCDDEAVAYAGRASVAGRPILQLVDCVGPILPQADFDSSEDLARQFELLRGAGAVPGRFPGFERPQLTLIEQVADKQRVCQLEVPATAAYFRDHFPRRPVFPATLLLDSAIRVAEELMAAHARAETRWTPARMTHVKMRDFVLPGQSVELSAEILATAADSARVGLTAKVGERTVATARIEFATSRGAG
jgi:3-hydroxymyristoyl/3-hydroxydecanoyl-(acyl carrier protein) dehydratase